MANLFGKQQAKKTLNRITKSFTSKEEFEKTIFETGKIIGDVFLPIN